MKGKLGKISFCMPVYKKEKTLERAIESLLDQDYKGWELIACLDGPDKACEKILKRYAKKDKRVSYIEIEHAGAPAARNAAARKATGDFLSFFSSDFEARPGMIRTWLEAFKNYPKADFVYGGYGLLGSHLIVPSEPFDPWLLEKYNYIDGGMPMRKRVWEECPWDESIKSLQDWDFWIVASKKGFKGQYIEDITYMAEAPKPEGLSYDSHQNWMDRVKAIKDKNGIPSHRVCFCSTSAPVHAIKAAKLADEDYLPMPSYKPHKYDAIYSVGFFSQNINASRVFLDGATGGPLSRNVKKIIHWIGSDILQLGGLPYTATKTLVESMKAGGVIHIAEFEQAKKELEVLGIEAEIQPLPVTPKCDITPLPKEFTVGVYFTMGELAERKYNLNLMRDVAKAMPDVKFKFFGNHPKTTDGNIEYMGWVDMKDLIPQCSMIVRMTRHDGLPISPIEFIMGGRDVLLTLQLPYMHYAGDGNITENNYVGRKEAVIEQIRKIEEGQKTRDEAKVKEARDYYVKLCSPETFKAKIEEILSRPTPKDAMQLVANKINEIGAKNLIEIGCGFGASLMQLKTAFPEMDVTGVDISEGYLQMAKERLGHLNPTFLKGNIVEKQPFKDGEFDLAFTCGLFIHVPPKDIEKAISETMRIAKQGLFIESSKNGTPKNELAPEYDPEIYWNERAKRSYADDRDQVQYYYAHDYKKLFNRLGLKWESLGTVDEASNTKVYWICPK